MGAGGLDGPFGRRGILMEVGEVGKRDWEGMRLDEFGGGERSFDRMDRMESSAGEGGGGGCWCEGRVGKIEFSVEKSTRSLLGTITSGEGLLQTFRGSGSVWLAPTQDIYQRLQSGKMTTLGSAPRSSNTAT